LALGISMQVIYRGGFHSHVVLSTGLLFGLGSNWFLGALVAEYGKTAVQRPAVRLAARCWPLLLAATMGIWFTQALRLEFIYLCSGVVFAFMLLHFQAQEMEHPSAAKRRPRPWTILCGLASYPTYLFHAQILLIMGSAILQGNLASNWWMVWLVTTAITIPLGLVLGHLVERPIMSWRAGLLKQLKATALSPAAREVGTTPALGVQQ
jgi:peptidoglycan/LPS O-acetylase OafA/YrhL